MNPSLIYLNCVVYSLRFVHYKVNARLVTGGKLFEFAAAKQRARKQERHMMGGCEVTPNIS